MSKTVNEIYEERAKLHNYKEKEFQYLQRKRLSLFSSIFFTVVLVICLILLHFFNQTDDVELLLALLSLVSTISYEFYAWIKEIFSKKNLLSTSPFLFTSCVAIILTLIKVFSPIWEIIVKYTNHICIITLLIYIFSTTIRTNYINRKELLKNNI